MSSPMHELLSDLGQDVAGLRLASAREVRARGDARARHLRLGAAAAGSAVVLVTAATVAAPSMYRLDAPSRSGPGATAWCPWDTGSPPAGTPTTWPSDPSMWPAAPSSLPATPTSPPPNQQPGPTSSVPASPPPGPTSSVVVTPTGPPPGPTSSVVVTPTGPPAPTQTAPGPSAPAPDPSTTAGCGECPVVTPTRTDLVIVEIRLAASARKQDLTALTTILRTLAGEAEGAAGDASQTPGCRSVIAVRSQVATGGGVARATIVMGTRPEIAQRVRDAVTALPYVASVTVRP